METAKLFANGQSQAVRLPKEYRFSGDEVGIARIGDLVVLFPKNRRDELFFSSLGNFTEDFFDSIASARAENFPDIPRESL
uniref:VapB protein (Antitoxin to VapC) n=1 Tax=uncultured bacterium contig00009 TaxID=1181501 RepID=A0A806KLS9_9BACT|nr:VapB protein (antitoxin to VapC) [uncultured bacterium contig00009]